MRLGSLVSDVLISIIYLKGLESKPCRELLYNYYGARI